MSCCALPGESRSGLWSTAKNTWAALTFFMAFLALVSSGSIAEDAVVNPGYLMFASLITLALIALPLVHREWAFGRDANATLITAAWVVASATFARAFAPLLASEAVTIGFPRALLLLFAIGAGVMAYRAGHARWPSATDAKWEPQLRALLGRYYSWPKEAIDEAVAGALEVAEEAELPPAEALGEPWQVAAEFVQENPQLKRLNAQFPLLAGIAFVGLAVASLGFKGVSVLAVILAVLGVGLIAFSRFLKR